MKNITPILVTAFFDIGRDSFKTNPRKIDKYFNDFKLWAGIKNDLVVFTSNVFKDRVLEIRKKFNLESKTKIITIENIFSIRNDLFLKAKEISQNYFFKNYRYRSDALSSIAEYDHLMFLKAYFIYESSVIYPENTEIIWIDFGFNHGNDYFINSNEFNFEIKSINKNKIWVFSLDNLDELINLPTFRIIQTLKDYIMGSIFFVPSTLAEWYWKEIQNSYHEIINLGLIDDDQSITFHLFKKYRHNFEFSISNWFQPLTLISGEKLSHNDNYNKNISYFSKLKKKFRLLLKKIRYAIIIFRSYEK